MTKQIRLGLPDTLHRRIRIYAVAMGRDMKEVIPELLERGLSSCEVTVTITQPTKPTA